MMLTKLLPRCVAHRRKAIKENDIHDDFLKNGENHNIGKD